MTWNGCGRPSGRSAITSPSSTTHSSGQAPDRLDDLGHAVGDVREAARIGAHLVVPAVHLQARAVELPFDPRPADALERLRHADGGLREHRLHGAEQLEPEAREAGRALREGDVRDPVQPTREHRRAANLRRRDGGRLRDGLDHDALERALAELTVDEPAEQQLLGLGRAAEELVELSLARSLRPGACRGAEAIERGGDVEQLERRRHGRRRELSQRRPADPEPRHGTGEERDRDRHLLRAQRPQAGGELLDLRRARARLRHGARGTGELGEQHDGILPGLVP